MMERLTEWKDDKKMLAKPKFRGDFGSQNILQSLAEYEDLEELIGIPLKNLAEICNNKIPEECRNPKKAIVLTDNDVDRWNEYKNADEQGLLLRLPCKVGDRLYYPEKEFNIVVPVRLNEIVISFLGLDTYSFQYNCCSFDECGDVYEEYEFDKDDFGKTVFLTKAEAEQKLKEMEREEEWKIKRK